MKRYVAALQKRAKNLFKRCINAYDILRANQKDSLHKYSEKAPDHQEVINLFEDEWISRFPSSLSHLKAGEAALFEDERVEWGIQQLGGVKGKSVLELGPLEGGHSYMLQNAGAESIIAVEGNPRAYLRCLMIKQILKLDRVEFLFGDFMEDLRKRQEKVDMILASGVLYHMQSPLELLGLICQKSSEIILWTHYYDSKICQQSFALKSKFLPFKQVEYQGLKSIVHPYKYGSARSWTTFIGGPAKTSNWMTRKGILDALKHFGFSDIHINFEKADHPNGPCFALTAKKP